MGDDPLLPLTKNRQGKVRATTAQIPVTTANRRERETIAEIWPEISFRQREVWLGILLDELRHHFKQQLLVKLVRRDEEVRFLLEDSASQAVHQLTLAEACRILEKAPGTRGQLLNREC